MPGSNDEILPYEAVQGEYLLVLAQLQFAVDYMNDCGILEEGCFTFPDGTTIHATQILTGGNDGEQDDERGDSIEEAEAMRQEEAHK